MRVKWWRAFDGANGTKPTSSGALLACDHEGGVAAGPTFVDVWTAGLFANGVKFVVLDGGLGGVEGGLLFSAGEAGSKPIGQAPRRRFWLTGGGHRERFSFHVLPPVVRPTMRSAKKVCGSANQRFCPTA